MQEIGLRSIVLVLPDQPSPGSGRRVGSPEPVGWVRGTLDGTGSGQGRIWWSQPEVWVGKGSAPGGSGEGR